MNSGVAKVLNIQDVPTFLVWGNNDGEKIEVMLATQKEGSNLTCALSTYAFLTLGGKKIFLTHYDDLAEPMAKSGDYDAVFYGHNHKLKKDKIGECWVVNPGEIAAQKTGIATYVIYDTEKNEIDVVELQGTITLKSDLTMTYFKENSEKLGFRSKDVMQFNK